MKSAEEWASELDISFYHRDVDKPEVVEVMRKAQADALEAAARIAAGAETRWMTDEETGDSAWMGGVLDSAREIEKEIRSLIPKEPA